MYKYRKLTPSQKKRVTADRKTNRRPWHAPPHFTGGPNVYIISAACFEHKHIMATSQRRTEFKDALLDGLDAVVHADVRAWVVGPNHYHLLIEGDLAAFAQWIGRLHNGKATQWNREDRTPGRKVWHRFSDRWIRSEGHYFSSLNYIHGNPVKHGWVKRADLWPWSSLTTYLKEVGRDTLAQWWAMYPVKDYGQGWDDDPGS
jgi:putative transposase